MKNIIVSRHPAAIEYLAAQAANIYPYAPPTIISGNATPEDVKGTRVWGNIPLSLASVAHSVWAIEFSGPPPRGTEYNREDMRAAGAHVVQYRVEKVPIPRCPRCGTFLAISQEVGDLCVGCQEGDEELAQLGLLY
jgi:hypothetical protein